jgi:hypothetical protein
MHVLGLRAAAAVAAGDDLEVVALKVVEVRAPAVVPVVDVVGVPMAWVRPVRDVAVAELGEDLIELARESASQKPIQ